MSGAAPVFDAAFRARLGELFAWRRDVRHFRRDALPAGTIERLVAGAALAPSVGNAQPWRFVRVVAARAALVAHVERESARAAGDYDPDRQAAYRALKLHGLREAPEILAVWSDDRPAAGHGLGIATMPEMLRYSTVMAIHGLWLAACAEGIGVGWVSILDPDAVRTMLGAPETWALVAILCIGMPQEPAAVPELERRGWQAREPVRLSER